MIEDPELSAAIETGRRELGGKRSKAAIVRELAIRGSRGLADDAERQRDAARELMRLIHDPAVMDWEAYEELRRRDTEPR